ncbi:MAG: hypothetical protein WCL05_01370 [Verrucomicrobiota bacterium]
MITNEEHRNNLIANAFHRGMEVYNYQMNIGNYTTMLMALPKGAWPDALAGYASTPVENIPPEIGDEEISAISDYQYRDKLRALLRTERVEQSKASRVLDALKVQIGADANDLIMAFKAAQI